jgi:hypothetical protein
MTFRTVSVSPFRDMRTSVDLSSVPNITSVYFFLLILFKFQKKNLAGDNISKQSQS